MRRKTTILAGAFAMLAAGLFAAGLTQAAESSGARSARIGPTVKIYNGEKCVEPTEEMRRNHMKYILHQRDETMHKGIRTTKHSLKNCIDCHADPQTDSVLGKDGFCESCHRYAAVHIDCFTCHSPSPEKDGLPRKASTTDSGLLMKMKQTSAAMDRVDGDSP